MPLDVANNGIGAAGPMPISPKPWRSHVPRDMKRALHMAPHLGNSDHHAVVVLAEAMHREGLLIRCQYRRAANMRAFAKAKLRF